MTAPLTGVLGDVAEILAEIEAEHHEAGWDNTPPTLYRVQRSLDGKYGVTPHRLIHLAAHGVHPRDELRILADLWESPTESVPLRTTLGAERPVAHLLVMEMWMNVDFTSSAQRESDQRDLKDIPGSLEARFGLAVMGKHILSTRHVKGSEPTAVVLAGPYEVWVGGMLQSLKRIQAAACR